MTVSSLEWTVGALESSVTYLREDVKSVKEDIKEIKESLNKLLSEQQLRDKSRARWLTLFATAGSIAGALVTELFNWFKV
jgi:hypothetical protein